jgi:lipoyl(octanoyl) transferase
MTRDELWVCHLGTIPYLDAVALQERIRAQRQADELPDTLLLLEHPPVYTRGRRSAVGELGAHSPDGWVGEDLHRARNIDIVDTDRGGRVTYHGPGQLVGYPIMLVANIGSYLRTMEDAIVSSLAEEAVEARSRSDEGPDYTGVWVGPRKIASIGVHVFRGIATHGFAVNVTNDLDPFSWIVACGLPGVAMTSIARELPSGRTVDLDRFRTRMAHHFCATHHRRQRLVSPSRLGIDAPIAPRRGGMPRASPPRAPIRCADAPQKNTTLDTPGLVTGRGALV